MVTHQVPPKWFPWQPKLCDIRTVSLVIGILNLVKIGLKLTRQSEVPLFKSIFSRTTIWFDFALTHLWRVSTKVMEIMLIEHFCIFAIVSSFFQPNFLIFWKSWAILCGEGLYWKLCWCSNFVSRVSRALGLLLFHLIMHCILHIKTNISIYPQLNTPPPR